MELEIDADRTQRDELSLRRRRRRLLGMYCNRVRRIRTCTVFSILEIRRTFCVVHAFIGDAI